MASVELPASSSSSSAPLPPSSSLPLPTSSPLPPSAPSPSSPSSPSSSSFSSSSSTHTPAHDTYSRAPRPHSKREYLLAQIRQKDVIIESLLKQLHNPYLATPLSIAAYRMATPSSDNHRQNVIAWLDRMQSSVRSAGGKAGPAAFTLDSRTRDEGADSEAEDDAPATATARRNGTGRQGSAGSGEGDSEPEPLSAHTLVDPEMENYPGLPDAAVPLGLLANLSISHSKTRVGAGGRAEVVARAENPEEDDDNVGVANDTYFLPGPAQDLALRAMLIDKSSPPDILVHGLVSPEDVDKLFDIFYTKVNPFIGLLEPALHTPASTFSRCPFLFTVVCATALRYSDKPEVYPIAMHFAKSAAANALIDGWKSVELCQAYILMSIYAVPARRWEEDRSWLYTGLAIRIATDLNLHQPQTRKPQNETQEREMLNRARVWMICYNLDRSTATQFGKPSTIKEDYIIRNSSDWYKKSKHNHAYDIHLNAYNSLLRIVAKFHEEVFSDPDSPTGLNKSIDFLEVTTRHDSYLTQYFEEWTERFARDSDPDDAASKFRCKLLPFLTNYSRLVMYSFGFQQAFHRGLAPSDKIYISKSLGAAKEVVQTLVDSLAPSGYMRYSPDGHFIFASFASAFLLKLLRPEFAQFLPDGQEAEIFELIGRLIQVLSSPQIAIDERHTPKLYSRFLAGLLSKHRRDGATTGRLHTQPPPAHQTQHPGQGLGGGGSQGIPRAPSASSSVMTPSSLEIQIQDPGAGAGAAQNAAGFGIGMAQEPVYQAEVAYAAGTGPLELGGGGDGMNFVFDSQGGMGGQEEMLATMQVIRNPAFWSNMMMPGFSWPEDPNAGVQVADPYYNVNMNGAGVGGGVGVGAGVGHHQNAMTNSYNFQMAQVPGMG
ncbi:hypothetical protein DENSPDRAFT_779779 [Dentipellis sp. KUC8613]|nr:hypothetical protein DENSPDRAFT_779779 [Dentipellis sp. KUC8613]